MVRRAAARTTMVDAAAVAVVVAVAVVTTANFKTKKYGSYDKSKYAGKYGSYDKSKYAGKYDKSGSSSYGKKPSGGMSSWMKYLQSHGFVRKTTPMTEASKNKKEAAMAASVFSKFDKNHSKTISVCEFENAMYRTEALEKRLGMETDNNVVVVHGRKHIPRSPFISGSGRECLSIKTLW